jgi:hypothetical protein
MRLLLLLCSSWRRLTALVLQQHQSVSFLHLAAITVTPAGSPRCAGPRAAVGRELSNGGGKRVSINNNPPHCWTGIGELVPAASARVRYPTEFDSTA